MTARRFASRPAGGFTLLEVMIALAILGIGLVMVMQLFAGALRLSRVDRGLTEAVLVAQQKMEELVLMDELEDGYEESGEDEGYSWTARAERLSPDVGLGTGTDPGTDAAVRTAEFIEQIGADDAVVPVHLHRLTVTVRWRFGESDSPDRRP